MKKSPLPRALLVALPLGFFLACGDEAPSSSLGANCPGGERCSCESDSDCDGGLFCRSDLCVDPDSRDPEDAMRIGGAAGESSMGDPDPTGTGSSDSGAGGAGTGSSTGSGAADASGGSSGAESGGADSGGADSGGSGSGASESGGGGSGGAGSGGDSGDATPCLTDDACAAEGKVCRTSFRHCVECNDDPDCPAGQHCSRGECLPLELTCETSRDCPTSLAICVQDHFLGGYCVECRNTADCPEEATCHFGRCSPVCSSDDECASDLQCVGTCVDCYAEDGCEEDEYCWGQVCKPKVCEPGTFRCAEEALVECNQYGSGYFLGPSCVGYPCVEESGQAACDIPRNPPPAGALNTNGDFSNDAPEWQANSGPVQLISEMACYGSYQVIGWPVDMSDAVTLTNGESYQIVFRSSVVLANLNSLAFLSIKIGGPEDPYPTFFEETSIALSEGHQQHSYSFTMNGATGSAGIAITFGGSDNNLICVDDVWILPD